MKRMMKVVVVVAVGVGVVIAVVSGSVRLGATVTGCIIGGALIMWAILKAGGNG